jgi:hypothetical protein
MKGLDTMDNPNPEGSDRVDPNSTKLLNQFKAGVGMKVKSAGPTLRQQLSQPNPVNATGTLPERSRLDQQRLLRNHDWYSNPGAEGSTDGGAVQPKHSTPVKTRNPFADPPDGKTAPKGVPSKPSR